MKYIRRNENSSDSIGLHRKEMGLGPSQVPPGTPSVAHMVDSHGETWEQRQPPQRAGHEPVQKTNSVS